MTYRKKCILLAAFCYLFLGTSLGYADWPGDYAQSFYVYQRGPYNFNQCNASEGWTIGNQGSIELVNYGLKKDVSVWYGIVYSMYCEDGRWFNAINGGRQLYFSDIGPGEKIGKHSEIFSIPCPDKKANFAGPLKCIRER